MTSNIDRIRLEAIEKRKNEAKEIVNNRKRKLSELYLVSNLSKVGNVVDENSLKSVKNALSSFLEQNDLESNSYFDIKTLIIDPPATVPRDKTILAESSSNQEKIEFNQNLLDDKTNSLPKDQEKNKESNLINKHHNNNHSQRQTSIIPTPIPRKPITKRKKTPESHISLYDPENRDAIETNVLVLKEYLPSKIAEATSLAELYYLAQTLPLVRLVPATHKAVTSTMYETALTEGKINVVHSRIEELKRQGKWSLRQPPKFVDPFKNNNVTYWDNVLSEMNWMAVDFKEERKLKIATCALIADSIKDYWKYGKVCCVKRREIVHLPEEIKIDDVLTFDAIEAEGETISNTDDVDQTIENEKQEKEDEEFKTDDGIDISKLLQRPKPEDEINLSKLPEISHEEYLKIKGKEQSPFRISIDTNNMDQGNKTLLDNIPTFQSFQIFNSSSSPLLIPVSKSLIPIEDESWYNVHLKQFEDHNDIIVDQQKGLFGFSSQKKINSSTKPPQPPNLKYLDLRTPTIWLPEDDQDLIEFVNQFSFNWGVVSAHLSKRPTRNYSSNIERRTPWQCFERYIQLNDTFQINDMRGQNTISAMKWLEHAHNIQATTKRRISPLGVGVDSIQRGHKRLRWASMFEAIRKCMRKRESITKPNTSTIRRNDDSTPLVAPTPSELSKLKYDRDKAIQDAYLQNPQNGFRTRVPNGGTQQHANKPQIPSSSSSSQAPQSAGAQIPQQQIQGQGQGQQIAQQQQIPQSGPQSRPVSVPQQFPQTQSNQSTPVPINASSNAASSLQSQGSTQYSANSPQIKRPISAIPAGMNVQRSNSNQYPPQVNAGSSSSSSSSTTPSGGANIKINPATGAPYTPEQIQQLLQLRQRKMMQASINSNGNVMIQGNASGANNIVMNNNANNGGGGNVVNKVGNNGVRQMKGVAPRANSNPIANNGGAGGSMGQGNGNGGGQDGRKMTFVPAHVSAIINSIQSQNPNMSKQDVTKIAAQYLANLQAKQSRANNSVAANATGATNTVSAGTSIGGNINTGIATTNSPNLQRSVSNGSNVSSPSITRNVVPTPQQILLQQQKNLQRANSNDGNFGNNVNKTNVVRGNIGASPALTAQQKAQLDMLKNLQFEQQQKRLQEMNKNNNKPKPKPK